MRDEDKTREQLMQELCHLREKIKKIGIRDFTDMDICQEETRDKIYLSEEKYAKAFRSNPDPITITSLNDGRYIEVNDAWVETTGFQRNEVLGLSCTGLDVWLNTESRDEMLQILTKQGSIHNYKVDFRMKSGEIRNFLVSAEMVEISNEPHLICVHKDITDNNRIRKELHVSEERFSKAFEASPSTISITTLEEGRYIDVNEAFCRIIGYSREEIIGHTSMEMGFWVDGSQRDWVKQRINEKRPVRDLEMSFRKKYGIQRLGLFSAEGIDIENTPCMLSITTDITDRKQAEEKIRYLSFHDNLTGIYNRAYFEQELTRLDTERQLPLSLILGDVNGLKLINDMLGHQEGDKLLITVAEILSKSCRQEDIVARWGGDEFIILLPCCSEDTAVKILDRIKKACQNMSLFPIDTSLSVGLAIKDNANEDIRDIIKEAEDKMYRNKLLEDKSTRSSFLTSLKKTLWTRSHETQSHCQRMQDISCKLGLSVNLPESELDNLKLLAALHDIGKIAIPNAILDKPGKLTIDECETIKKHTEIGYRIALSSPELAPIAEAILHHHERWDGAGYPLGLKGDEIPLISRIVSIADAYDVMIYGRPYQTPCPKEAVWDEIEKCSGSQFDPYLGRKALELFFSLL